MPVIVNPGTAILIPVQHPSEISFGIGCQPIQVQRFSIQPYAAQKALPQPLLTAGYGD